MPRIFAALAFGELIVLLGVVGLGSAALEAGPSRHVLLALFALLLSCLIQVIAFTYLTVTGKMIAQAVHLGDLGMDAIDDVKRIKRTFARLLVLVVGAVLFATITGARHWRSEGGAWPHLIAALVVLAVHVGAYYRQYGLVVENAALGERTLARYAERRSRVEPPAAAGSRAEEPPGGTGR